MFMCLSACMFVVCLYLGVCVYVYMFVLLFGGWWTFLYPDSLAHVYICIYFGIQGLSFKFLAAKGLLDWRSTRVLPCPDLPGIPPIKTMRL